MKYAGIDWTYNGYDLVVIDGTGHCLERFQVNHSEHSLRELAAFLHALTPSETEDSLVCVIPSSNGVIGAFLSAVGFSVSVVKPASLLMQTDWNMPSERTNAALLAELGRRQHAYLATLDQTSALIDTTDETFQVLGTRASSSLILAAYEQEFKHSAPCFKRGPQEYAKIALTFDDGPHPVYTPQILAILRHYGIQATFFCIGLHLGTYTTIARQAQAEGHLLANHTWSHPYLTSLFDDDIIPQMVTTNTFLRKQLGIEPHFFRPPYGAMNVKTIAQAASCGMTTVLWSINPNDWAMPGKESIVDRTVKRVENGSIILLHDGGGDRHQTVEALPILIEKLLQANFTFVALDQMI